MTTTTKTITVAAAEYQDADDCLTSAAAEIARRLGVTGWELAPRWASDEREAILLDVPVSVADGHVEEEDDQD